MTRPPKRTCATPTGMLSRMSANFGSVRNHSAFLHQEQPPMSRANTKPLKAKVACITSNPGGSSICTPEPERPLTCLHRPGLQDFLHKLSTKYEMHVYTMGTRAYAEEVCAAIDSNGKIFGGRILSRDESGSESVVSRLPNLRSCFSGLTQKSLQRLFPCDTSMVVIIDDRADVWEWSPNLIKVIPCEFLQIPSGGIKLMCEKDDFFVGIGDINSAFLPKVEPLAPTVHAPTLG